MAGNIAKRANGKWRARYDEAGKENLWHFDRKIDPAFVPAIDDPAWHIGS